MSIQAKLDYYLDYDANQLRKTCLASVGLLGLILFVAFIIKDLYSTPFIVLSIPFIILISIGLFLTTPKNPPIYIFFGYISAVEIFLSYIVISLLCIADDPFTRNNIWLIIVGYLIVYAFTIILRLVYLFADNKLDNTFRLGNTRFALVIKKAFWIVILISFFAIQFIKGFRSLLSQSSVHLVMAIIVICIGNLSANMLLKAFLTYRFNNKKIEC